jgi:hypothetical protein
MVAILLILIHLLFSPTSLTFDCGVGCFANFDRRTPGVAFGETPGVRPTNSQPEPAKPLG